jgi:hypothetical protein
MEKFSQRIHKMSNAALSIIICIGFLFVICIFYISMNKSSPVLDNSSDPNWSPLVLDGLGTRSNPIKLDTTPMNYRSFVNYSVNPIANIGSPIPNKNPSECQILCGSTNQCTGFITTGGNCQLVNNVSILERSQGDTIYASQDIGASKYMHVPYAPLLINTEKLYSVTSQLGDAVSNCDSKTNNCGAFSSNGNGYDMYPTIIAVDSTIPGDTYNDPNKPLKFIREGNFNYHGTPDKSWSIDNTKIIPNPPPTFLKDLDFFHLWRSNWDANQDNKGPLSLISGVSGPDKCSNLCMSNNWCQSFVVGKGSEDGSCWLRHDPNEDNKCFSGWTCPPPPGVAGAGWCMNNDGVYCNSDNPADCGGTRNYKSCATSSQTRDTYYKYQYPIDVQCPMACASDGSCKLSTFNATTGICNQYSSPVPGNKTSDSSMTAVWNVDNFPG